MASPGSLVAAARAALVVLALSCGLGCIGPLVHSCHLGGKSGADLAIVFTSNGKELERSHGHMLVVDQIGDCSISEDPRDGTTVDLFDGEGPKYIEVLPGSHMFSYGYARNVRVATPGTVEAGQCYAPVLSCPSRGSKASRCVPRLEPAGCPSGWFARKHQRRGIVAGKKGRVPPAALACQVDSDCEISAQDLDKCGEPCPVEPYAISREGAAAINASCPDVGYTEEECLVPGIARPSDFVAVCADHQCLRRSR